MQIKNMRRSEWTEITAKKQIILPYERDGRSGKISLFRILSITEPFVINRNGHSETLADVNYTWVQLAMEQDFAWFTVMFDAQNRFRQIYIDVTSGNRTDCEDPYFEDMFLDYAVTGESVLKLDEEELAGALRKGWIGEETYGLVQRHGDMIETYLDAHKDALTAFFVKTQKELNALLSETGGNDI